MLPIVQTASIVYSSNYCSLFAVFHAQQKAKKQKGFAPGRYSHLEMLLAFDLSVFACLAVLMLSKFAQASVFLSGDCNRVCILPQAGNKAAYNRILKSWAWLGQARPIHTYTSIGVFIPLLVDGKSETKMFVRDFTKMKNVLEAPLLFSAQVYFQLMFLLLCYFFLLKY